MITLGKRSVLQRQSGTSIVSLLVVSAARRPTPLCATWRCTSPAVPRSTPSTKRSVTLTTCSYLPAPLPCMPCICYLIQHGPPTAFLLFRPQCTVGVLAGTHWGALRCPSRMASGTKRQPLSNALLHCCCTAEPVLTRATKHTPLRPSTRVVGFGRLG